MRSNEEISRDMAGMKDACMHQGHGCTHPVCDCERPEKARSADPRESGTASQYRIGKPGRARDVRDTYIELLESHIASSATTSKD